MILASATIVSVGPQIFIEQVAQLTEVVSLLFVKLIGPWVSTFVQALFWVCL